MERDVTLKDLNQNLATAKMAVEDFQKKKTRKNIKNSVHLTGNSMVIQYIKF